MKKIIFGIVALFIVTFGLYAFTQANSEAPTVATEEVQLPLELHWFPIDGSGNAIPQDVEPPKVPRASSGCPDAGGPVCKKGYTSTATNGAGKYIPAGANPENATNFP